MQRESNIIDELTEMEKDIFNRELLFMKYVNNYVYLSKDIPEEKLRALSEKYNKDGIVLKVLNDYDNHHNEKREKNNFQTSNALKKISENFSSLSDEEKEVFIKKNHNLNSFISKNKEWQSNLEAATEALMYTIQELA